MVGQTTQDTAWGAAGAFGFLTFFLLGCAGGTIVGVFWCSFVFRNRWAAWWLACTGPGRVWGVLGSAAGRARLGRGLGVAET